MIANSGRKKETRDREPAGEVTNLVKPSTGAKPAQRAKPQPPRDEDEYAAVSSAAVLRRLADEYAAMFFLTSKFIEFYSSFWLTFG